MNKKSTKSKIQKVVQDINDACDSPVFRIGDKGFEKCRVLPTGSYELDLALGVGGLPRGRIGEIYGEQQSGKTLISLMAIAETQKRGGTCALIDAEFTFDPAWAAKIGVNVDDLVIQQPGYGEDGLRAVEAMVKSGLFDLIVVDSVANLVPKKELDGELGKDNVALQARMMAQALRRLTSAISETDTVVAFINQTRDNIGVMWGNPKTTPGGRALKFYSSFRLNVAKRGTKKQGTEKIGHEVKVTVSKNKVAPPYKTAEFDLYYKTGVDKTSEIFSAAKKLGIITRSGNTYSFEDNNWVGKKEAKQAIESSEELIKKIDKQIRKKMEEIRNNL